MTARPLRLGIFGAGGHAKVVADTAWRGQNYVPVAFYDDDVTRHNQVHYRSVEIRGDFNRLLDDLSEKVIDAAFVAIGNNDVRATLGQQILEKGFSLATLVDPNAVLSSSVILGSGTLVVAGAIINADTHTGSHVIINTAASIDHDCMIDDGAHIAPNATLCGGARVGKRTLIGVGATLLPSTEVPQNSVVGGGSVITYSLQTSGNYVGCPARLLAKR